jgi:membrane protein YqaA with SNARE-associated domain
VTSEKNPHAEGVPAAADAKSSAEQRAECKRANILRFLGLLAVIGLSALIFAFRDQVKMLTGLGYPGIFLIALLSNATVLFPAPGVAVVFAMGGVFHPLGVALAAGTGGAIGELSGYLAGWSGQTVVERMDIFERITPYIKKYGPFGIAALAAIPNPFFDLAGIAAGMLKMPLWRFLVAVWIGQLVKMLLFAYAGSLSLNWLFR